MKPIHHHQRHEPDQEFQECLTQLEDILQANCSENQVISEVAPSNSDDTDNIDLAALEDAVADIEKYLAQKDKKPKN